MTGFRNVREYKEAHESGQTWFTQFRKLVASATSVQNAWIDYSYYGGSPTANFYASSPLEAALLDSDVGIYVPTVAPAKQFLKNLMLLSLAAGVSATNGKQALILADYLMYYPFIDTDAIGEEQTFVNAVDLPRYGSGKVVAVGQSASATEGAFTFTYTNQDGVAGRVSPVNRTAIVGGGGHVVGASGIGQSYNPFLNLQAGDYEAKSIESINMSIGGGGLMCLAIVKPLLTAAITQECRRDSTNSFGAATEFSSLIHHQPPEIKEGAVLGFLGAGLAGSLGGSALVGTLETIWN